MKAYKKQMTLGKQDYTVVIEHFTSMHEAMQVVSQRTPRDQFESDFFFNGHGHPYRDFYGFDTEEEFRDICSTGVKDTDVVKDVRRYTAKAQVEMRDKLSKRAMGVAGGAVDVPAYLCGIPECMVVREMKPVKSRVINCIVEVGVNCWVSPERYIRAGRLIAQTIASLEKAGYRIRLTAADFTMSNADRSKLSLMTVVVKREQDVINYKRMLVPLTSTAFFRGLGFSWLSSHPDFNPGCGLGCSAAEKFGSDGVAKALDVAFNNESLSFFTINSIVDKMNGLDDADVLKYLKARMLNLE